MSRAELEHRRLIPAACVPRASPGAMLLVLLPVWLALGILQLPLGSTQVRTLMPPAPNSLAEPPLGASQHLPRTPQHLGWVIQHSCGACGPAQGQVGWS